MDELRPAVGTACTKSIPGLPLSKNLVGRWSQDSPLSPSQAQQMFITHLLFTFTCSLCSMWPLQLHTGDQESGKSTPFELFLTLLANQLAHATMMPGKERDLIAAITNNPIIVFDNIDGAKLDDPSRSNYQDYICGMATGAQINMAKLFRDNVRDKYKLHNHGFFTARVNPFTRPDVLRRCIHLEMAPPAHSETIDKDVLKSQVLESRSAILAEIALRAQNILKAHQTRKTYRCQSEMSEYENFTLRCAEYEGTLEETKQLWSNYVNQYRQSITASNPLVFAARLWIGKGNAGRQVSPETLFVEMQTVFMETRQRFPFTVAAIFGKQIAANLRPLQMLGFRKIPTRSNHDYIFEPSPLEEERCTKMYRDYTTATSKRSISSEMESWLPDDDSVVARGTAKLSQKETVQ